MKLKETSALLNPDDYPQVIHNCNLSPCEKAYRVPAPELAYVQLYINFGTYKPLAITITAIDTCDGSTQEQLFTANYVVGQDPDGNWYGVFKYFDATAHPFKCAVIHVQAFVNTPAGFLEKVYFSEEICFDDCNPITKVKACFPEGNVELGFDVNGIYYGLPTNLDTLGNDEVRYFHIAYVRQGKVRESSNKIEFKSHKLRNFRSSVEKQWLFEFELVPQWYKDYLLSIFSRGAIEIEGQKYMVSELQFEGLNDDDLTWKAYATLKHVWDLYFGCDESVCVECCSPTVLAAVASCDGEGPGGSSGGSTGGSTGGSSGGGSTGGTEHLNPSNYVSDPENGLAPLYCSFDSFKLNRTPEATAAATAAGQTVKVRVKFISDNLSCPEPEYDFFFGPTDTFATNGVFICVGGCTEVNIVIVSITVI